MNNSDLRYFAPDYSEARAGFLAEAENLRTRKAQSELFSFQVPSATDHDLFVDTFYAPATSSSASNPSATPANDTLLILTSGVHGIEGFTGSAIQRMFLSELAPLLPQEGLGLLVVHALNPYGFKYRRRSTQANVNLNRNFATDLKLFATENPNYDRLASLLEPNTPVVTPTLTYLTVLTSIATAMTLKGFNADRLNRGIALGQFRHPRGLEYGGHAREPQTDHYLKMLERILPGYRELILLDLHTGLGERYALHLIPGDTAEATDPALLERLFGPLSNSRSSSSARARPFIYTPSTAEGFYETLGDMNRVLPALARPDQTCLSLTFEFGTLGNGGLSKIDTLFRVYLENQAYHCGAVTETVRRKVDRLFSELFFPSEEKWRLNALGRSRAVLSDLADRLRSRSAMAG